MIRRRRPLMRSAMVGGAAYYTGKMVQEGREGEAETEARLDDREGEQAAPAAAPAGGMTDATIEQLQKLGELRKQGILTEDEFEQQKQKLLDGT